MDQNKRNMTAAPWNEEQVFSDEDLSSEILSRLPVKSVVRCRCVCKAWRALISHPFFVIKYTSRRTKSKSSFRLLLASFPLRSVDYEAQGVEVAFREHYYPIGLSMAAHSNPLDDVLEWVRKDHHHFRRANIRVGDLDRTIKFYTQFFGMEVLGRKDFPEEKYSNAVIGFGPEETHFVLGLTQDYGAVDKLELGTAFNHFGIATQDIYTTVERIRAAGGVITREPGPVAEGGATIYAFVKDPDGYSFELLLRPPTPEPLCQICLNVADIDRAINFYEKALGMNLLQPKYDIPQDQYTVAIVGYGSNLTQTTTIELTYNHNVTEYTNGNGYAQVAIGTDDVYKSSAAVELVTQEVGGKIIRSPGPIPKINTKITAFLDRDDFETVLVGNEDYLKQLEKER